MNDNELKIKVSDCHQRECIFKRVPASELRLDDDFIKHRPKTDAEMEFKKLLKTAIKRGLKDFWRPVCDPSLDHNGRICYERGKMPALGKSYNWWAKTAKEFKPEQGSRLGTKTEYIAFLAVLIKELVNSGKSVEWAWNAVCNNSKELGNYFEGFEPTGSREVCGWYDLANTYKILKENLDIGGFWLACGYYNDCSFCKPLAHLSRYYIRDLGSYDTCGWLVFDSCPDC